MTRAIWSGVTAVGLLAGSAAAWADTFLEYVTPKTLEKGKFKITSKAAPKDQVEFVITRDIRGIDGPGRQAFLSNPKLDGKGLGTLVKLEEDPDKTLTYRFSVRKARVADMRFVLWGQGIRGEGITFEFKLADFWKP